MGLTENIEVEVEQIEGGGTIGIEAAEVEGTGADRAIEVEGYG